LHHSPKSSHKQLGIAFGHRPHVNNDFGRGIKRLARQTLDVTVDMAYA